MEQIFEKLADSVSGAKTLEDLTRPMLEILEAVTGLESTYLTTIDVEQGFQHILFSRNTSDLQIPEGLQVPWDDTLCKRALDEGRMFTDDVGTCWGDSDAARELGITTYLSTPVRTDRGELYGTLCAASSSKHPLPEDAQRILAMFSRMIGQHVERERLLEELQSAYAAMEAAALTDPLTGLPNRRRLFQEMTRMLSAARRSGDAVVVAFIDLDGFKTVNDTFGHAVGDRLLATFAARLSASSRAEDLVARVGGDEFVIVASTPRDMADDVAARIAERVDASTAASVDIGDTTIRCRGISVGLVVAGSDAHADEIMALADARMYAAKQAVKRDTPGAAQSST